MAGSEQVVAACRACVAACDAFIQENREAAKTDAAVRHCIETCKTARRICLSIEELPYASGFALRLCRLGAVVCRAAAEECELQAGPAAAACVGACRECVDVFHALAVVGTVRAKSLDTVSPAAARAAQRARFALRPGLWRTQPSG